MQEMKDVETAEADGRVQDNTVCDKRIPEGHVGATLDDLVRILARCYITSKILYKI